MKGSHEHHSYDNYHPTQHNLLNESSDKQLANNLMW